MSEGGRGGGGGEGGGAARAFFCLFCSCFHPRLNDAGKSES